MTSTQAIIFLSCSTVGPIRFGCVSYCVRIATESNVCHVVYIQCSKLFKGMEFVMLYNMLICTMKNSWSLSRQMRKYYRIASVKILPKLFRKRRKTILWNAVTSPDAFRMATRWKQNYIRRLSHTSLYYLALWKYWEVKSIEFHRIFHSPHICL